MFRLSLQNSNPERKWKNEKRQLTAIASRSVKYFSEPLQWRGPPPLRHAVVASQVHRQRLLSANPIFILFHVTVPKLWAGIHGKFFQQPSIPLSAFPISSSFTIKGGKQLGGNYLPKALV
ncbi:hypothetical protein Tsp_05495 [Trichinella spiralis]|uniref:hypothetical protein n=1 Tax=Trichinella spiralis TaxID=6334 RepID=UPI0001EFD9A7|nr:hypothetical protein Tsp_05495 [Trichinella spiralis]